MRQALLAALTALLVTCSACGSEPAAGGAPTSPTRPTVTSTPTATPLTSPAFSKLEEQYGARPKGGKDAVPDDALIAAAAKATMTALGWP